MTKRYIFLIAIIIYSYLGATSSFAQDNENSKKDRPEVILISVNVPFAGSLKIDPAYNNKQFAGGFGGSLSLLPIGLVLRFDNITITNSFQDNDWEDRKDELKISLNIYSAGYIKYFTQWAYVAGTFGVGVAKTKIGVTSKPLTYNDDEIVIEVEDTLNTQFYLEVGRSFLNDSIFKINVAIGIHHIIGEKLKFKEFLSDGTVIERTADKNTQGTLFSAALGTLF